MHGAELVWREAHSSLSWLQWTDSIDCPSMVVLGLGLAHCLYYAEVRSFWSQILQSFSTEQMWHFAGGLSWIYLRGHVCLLTESTYVVSCRCWNGLVSLASNQLAFCFSCNLETVSVSVAILASGLWFFFTCICLGSPALGVKLRPALYGHV